ncbi:MAG: dependent oxidoreductase [Chloroflexi bacterium]|nr:dependent oxidoreductase [Chloroflexota bacterium]
MGPLARTLLRPLCESDLSHAAFPFGTARRVAIGPTTALAVRVTYVGELGWELHVPVEQLAALFKLIESNGRPLGMKLAGSVAMNSLRIEKSYCAWGAELSTDETPIHAGLGFAVAWNKPDEFLGKHALELQRAEGVRKRLVTLVLDDPSPILWGGEPIYRDDEPVGYTSSGSYAHARRRYRHGVRQAQRGSHT